MSSTVSAGVPRDGGWLGPCSVQDKDKGWLDVRREMKD